MFGKIKRRGPKDKRTVTNVHSMVVIPDGEKERNAMLDQPTQRTNKWLSMVAITGARGTNLH
jgi:hypothetical protein